MFEESSIREWDEVQGQGRDVLDSEGAGVEAMLNQLKLMLNQLKLMLNQLKLMLNQLKLMLNQLKLMLNQLKLMLNQLKLMLSAVAKFAKTLTSYECETIGFIGGLLLGACIGMAIVVYW